MSDLTHYDVLAAVRRYEASTSGEKFTLVVLAEYLGLHDDEWSCFPSNARLSTETQQHPSTVRRHLADLEAAGVIERRSRGRRGGGRDANAIVLNVDVLLQQTEHRERFAGEQTRIDDASKPRPTSRANRALRDAHKEQLHEQPTNDEQRDARAAAMQAVVEATQRFDEHFWPTYPDRDGKRLGKAKALDLWLKLDIDTQRAVVKGARHFAAAVRAGGRFGVPDPWRWLRDRGWLEWQTPAHVARPANGGAPQSNVARSFAAIANVLGDDDETPTTNGTAIDVVSSEKGEQAC